MPHSRDGEISVLGGLLIDNRTFDSVSYLRPTDFYVESHRIIFKAIRDIINTGGEADALTLFEHLRKQGTLEAAGGPKMGAYLADIVPSPSVVPAHARVVKEAAVRRELISILEAHADEAYEADNVQELADRAEAAIYKATQSTGHSSRAVTTLEMLKGVVKGIQRRSKGEASPGIQTGFRRLDELLTGLRGGQLIILAARPGIGKTSLAINIACNVSLAKKRVGFFSLEMGEYEIGLRVLSSQGRVPGQRLRQARMRADDTQRVCATVTRMVDDGAPMVVDDSTALSPNTLRSRCRRMRREHGLDLVVVDYIQLMRGDGRTGSRNEEVGSISRGLKLLARELDVPVLALSQLNRESVKTKNRRPAMHDLRDSGSLEQDADVVLFLHKEGDEDEVELSVAKQRMGPTGRMRLQWWEAETRFEDLED